MKQLLVTLVLLVTLPLPTAKAALSVEAVGGNSGQFTDRTVGLTVTSANLLIACVGIGDGARLADIAGVTWNGMAMTAISGAEKDDGIWVAVKCFRMASPAAGSFNVVADVDLADQSSLAVISFIDASSTLGTPSVATATTANPSVTVADSASGEIVVSMSVNDNETGNTLQAGTLIFEHENQGSDTDHSAQYQTASGSNHVASWIQSGSGTGWAAVGFAVSEDGGGGGGYTLPTDRSTTWQPGVTYNGGIPVNRTQCGSTLTPSGGNDLSQINNAIVACGANQYVLLGPGTFTISGAGASIEIKKSNVTLRGSGPGVTILTRSDGAVDNDYHPNAAAPIIWVGPNASPKFPTVDGGAAYDLASNGVDGATSVVLASAPMGGFAAGQIVLISELSGAFYQTDPSGRGQILMSADGKVTYQCHSPPQGTDDCRDDAYSLPDRITQELKEVASWNSGTMTLTFTSPLHTAYRTSNVAQVATFAAQHTPITRVGVESMTISRGDQGNLLFMNTAYSWAKEVESTKWLNEGIMFLRSFRGEMRDSYVHTPVWFEPGGASYAIAIDSASSEILVENSISRDVLKVIVCRDAGAGSVIGYNYMDDAYQASNLGWQETGLGASHFLGCHHVLFEGNWAFNADNDKTHGNANTHTYFRNHLRGKRSAFTDPSSGGSVRAAAATATTYYMSFVGNVLGASGQMTGFDYENATFHNGASIWLLGWDDWDPYPVDPMVLATTIRDGNFDYLTNQVHWHGEGGSGSGNGLTPPPNSTLPESMYLPSKPSFFGSLTWPWVNPTGATKLYENPAKRRFDLGTPFAPPP